MKIIFLQVLLGFAFYSFAQKSLPALHHQNKETLISIVEKIVINNAQIKKGELVLITGGSAALSLMDAFALAVGKAGAFPMIRFTSDELLAKWYDHVPASYDSIPDKWLLYMNTVADVVIEIDSYDAGIYAAIPQSRLDAREMANSIVYKLWQDKQVRILRVGNGLFPSPANAKNFNIALPELQDIFWKAVSADPKELADSGEKLRHIIEKGSVLQLVHPNGTNIRVDLAKAKIIITDGTTSGKKDKDEEINITWLPGGELTTALMLGSAEGRIVTEKVFFDGEAIEKLDMKFKTGKLISISSKKNNHQRLAEAFASSKDGDQLTGIKFGINNNVRDPRVLPLMGGGMFSISMGSNIMLGGDFDLPFILFLPFHGSTVYVDDKIILEKGVFRLN
jgi:leucyl aminopeptidase (aminopeptidase T)